MVWSTRALAILVVAADIAFLGRVTLAYIQALPGDSQAIQRAARILPFVADSYSPDLSIQAGHLLDSQGLPSQALPYYRASLDRDPYQSATWLLAASAAERSGLLEDAEAAYRHAARYEPNYPQTYWMWSNFQLRHGRTQEALRGFRELLTRSRRFDDAVFQTASQMLEARAMEAEILPDKGPADLPYFRFVLRRGDVAAVERIFPRLAPRDITGDEIDAYCRLLAAAGRRAESWAGWRRWSGHDGATLLRNGGWEHESAGGPFDWVLASNAALHAFRDTAVSHSQGGSAQVLFLGKENFGGTAIEQWTHLQARRPYRLSFRWRSTAITTDRAPVVQVWETGPQPRMLCAAETEPGTSGWREQSCRFLTGENPLVRVSVEREPSQRLDNRISGSFWLDDVTLLLQ